MTVYLLIREDQNDYGYVDTSIVGVFLNESVARDRETLERRRASDEGLLVEDDDCEPGAWQVSLMIAPHQVT